MRVCVCVCLCLCNGKTEFNDEDGGRDLKVLVLNRFGLA